MSHIGIDWHKFHKPRISPRALAWATLLALAVGIASTPFTLRYILTQLQEFIQHEGDAIQVDKAKASFCRSSNGLC